MGSKSPSGPTPEEEAITTLQRERLVEEQRVADNLKREQQAMMKARRSGGMGGLLSGSESGTSGGYSSLLGG